MMQSSQKASASLAIGALVVMSVLLAGCGEATEAVETSPPPAEAAAPTTTATEPALAPSQPAPGEPDHEAPAEPAGEIYVVQPGDTLAEIAHRMYGEYGQWERIYEANREVVGDDPDALQVDMELRIPPRE